MASFLKNGERVRVVRNGGTEEYDFLIGQTGIILVEPSDGDILVQMNDGELFYFFSYELERIEGESE